MSTTEKASPHTQAHESILDRLACPACRRHLQPSGDRLNCPDCQTKYAATAGIFDLRPQREDATELDDWSEHWSQDKQQSLPQRFFSVYRKAVFARTVRFYVNRYLSPRGVLVEAGSGTSETSMRLKPSSQRTLVALDIVLPVLQQCHPVMDVRLCGDLFRLPWLDESLDGVWNVGVMEHFTHAQIDQIMQEIARVLKPGARVVLLWPGVDSVPQRMLRCVEWLVNLKPRKDRFRFHPDEISQLRSRRQGRDVLERNGLRPITVDFGLRSLLAFKIVVGEKPVETNVED